MCGVHFSKHDSQSQSFFQRYGSNLPTSLNYFNLLTRGFEPWRPDAVVGTDIYIVHDLALIVSWTVSKAQVSTYVDIFQNSSHFITLSISMAVTLLNNDENAVLACETCIERTLVTNALCTVSSEI